MISLNDFRNRKNRPKGTIRVRISVFLLSVFILFGVFLLAGCNGDSSSESGTGTVSLYMTDAVTDEFKAVYVTIDEVAVHISEDPDTNDDLDGDQAENSGWKVVATPQETYNLLELVNGVMTELGTTELESGHYTQIRLMLGENPDDGTNINGNTHPYPNYVIDQQDAVEKLKVPSGYQTGIKLVHGFDLAAGQTAELLLDFDAARSVVRTGNGKYLLKPTIKILDNLDYPLIRGVVSDETGDPLSNAIVSAQQMDAQGNPEVFTTTRTEDTEGADGDAGAYQMYLPIGDYYIVAYKGNVTDEQGSAAAYGPACTTTSPAQIAVYEQNDLSLELSGTGDIPVDVILPTATKGVIQTATLSVRKSAPCSEVGDQIEIVSETVAQSGTYQFAVPGSQTGEEYTVVAASGDITLEEAVTVTEGETEPAVTFDFTD
ncbi:MAG: DUF4382 domain-containing protein [Desulfobacteraceae bacterium]|nr:DUF4382 domain-containing protein [Desulfobacteraceae bacterium]